VSQLGDRRQHHGKCCRDRASIGIYLAAEQHVFVVRSKQTLMALTRDRYDCPAINAWLGRIAGAVRTFRL